MSQVGLKDLFCARITTDANGIDTYAIPRRLAKAISSELSTNVAEAQTYADDAIDEVLKEFVDGELKLKVNDLLPADIAELLGQTQDADGVVYAGENDEAPYFAIGFRSKKGNGMYKYVWLYKVKFSIPSESYATKGDGIEFVHPEITGKFIKRHDGLWKADYTALPTDELATTWFNEVRRPAVAGTLEDDMIVDEP